MKIMIEIIPHKNQRYDTAGDWQLDIDPADPDWPKGGELLTIRVSDTGDWKSNMLVAIHELAEAVLCKAHGVTGEQVDAWDMGPGRAMKEPGNDHRAPHFNEHSVAEYIEHALARELISWPEHEKNLDKLEWKDEKDTGISHASKR